MTRAQVCTAVIDSLREAQLALAGEAPDLAFDAKPSEFIPGFDSLATVEVTTTICVTLGIADVSRNPFLEDNRQMTIGQVIDAFCTLAGVAES